MGYPPQNYPPQPGYGYPPAPQQGGYAQQPYPQQNPYPQQQQYPQQGYGAPAGGGMGYDFASLYGQADHSASMLYDAGLYDSVVEASDFGKTKDGTKGAWTIKFRTTSGANAGKSPVTMTLSISPNKRDGSPNGAGMGIMFRQLGALGVPVPPESWPPALGPVPPAPFWINPQTGQPFPDDGNFGAERYAAALMTGRPCQIKIAHDDSYDGTPRMKIAAILPPRPGAPTSWQQAQQPSYQAAAPPAQYGVPGPQAGPAVPPGQPGQPAYAQPSANPALPPWAQAATPGQGGLGEYTPQGMSTQPAQGAYAQPPAQQFQGGYGVPGQPAPGAPPAQAAPPVGPPPVPQPPWQGQQPQGQQQLPYPPQGQPPLPQGQYNGQQPQAAPEGPPKPPWEQ
ncbi:MAG TPA: hypothetical protein VGI66_03495 [Streptosporangiaceae bacterium]